MCNIFSELTPKAFLLFFRKKFIEIVTEKSCVKIKNLEEKEKYSGFQDLYIDMHKEALKQFVLFEHKHKYSSKEETKEYLKSLNKIIDSPFLNEFLLEQYKMILIVPEDTILNFEEYHKWKSENNFDLELKLNLSEARYEL